MKKHSDHTHTSFLGATTGLIVGIFLQPLEIIKTNLIINPTKNPKLANAGIISGLYHGSKEIYSLEGLKGFIRGMTPAMLRIIISTSIFFSGIKKFDHIFHQIKEENSIKNKNKRILSETSINFFSSAISRIFSGVLTNPITVIRTRFEVIGFDKYVNMRHAFNRIYQDEGLKGFGVGALTSAMKDAPFAGIYFVIYIKLKRFLEEEIGTKSLLMNSFVSGMTAGVIATSLTNPFDVIRTRLQYGFFIKEEELKYKGIGDGFRKIYKMDGFKGFFKGLAPRLIRKPASNALTFVVFEGLHKIVNEKEAF